ncbi:MAG: hypothetical protein LBL27_03255 [Coriobacteriales bacterium]|jgi:hypothetical protein|nr:hypothetical protein [Coriobacteriales bacterium]
MRFIGDDGKYHQIPIKLNEEEGRELRRLIDEQKTKKMDYTQLFKKREIDAKNRV